MYRNENKNKEVYCGKMDQLVYNNRYTLNKSTERISTYQSHHKHTKNSRSYNNYSQEYDNTKYPRKNITGPYTNKSNINKPNEDKYSPINLIQSFYSHNNKIIDNLVQNYNKYKIILVHDQNQNYKQQLLQYSYNDLFNNLSKIFILNEPTFIVMENFDIENKFCWLNFKLISNFMSNNINNKKLIKLIIISENTEILLKYIPDNLEKFIKIINNNNAVTIFDDKSVKYPFSSCERYKHAAEIVKNYVNKKCHGNYLVLVPNKEQVFIVKKYLSDVFSNIYIINNNNLPKYETQAETQIYIATEDISHQLLKNLKINTIIDTMTTYKKSDNVAWKSKISCLIYKNILEKNGTYVCMTSESFYLSLPDYNHESLNIRDIITILNVGSNYIDLLICDNVKILLKYMHDNGICDANNNLTEIGKFCNDLPLEIRNSLLLNHLNKQIESNISIYLCILCTIELYGTGIFVWPKKSENEDIITYSMRVDDIISELENKYGGYSDIDTIFNVWKDLINKCSTLSMLDVRKYCETNSLNFNVFKRIISLIRECIKINHIKNYQLKISFNKNEITIPSNKEFSTILYKALEISHNDLKATIFHNYKSGKSDILLGNKIYRIDNRSIHTMDTANDSNKIYYVLSFNNYAMTRGENINIVNLLHTISLENEYTFEDMFDDLKNLDGYNSDNYAELFPD
ncbi:helicase HrpA [Moumouvirus goulette]|uniref:Helicase HrpA n=1 Tax=Moumouvirus goulette TaxID=1247379 RepID=M1PWI2_9VIRU|nr:helicase HrpA [Moumouvirus goulette]AGF85112.1 helicase HrpA [Moumouvirus goulette]